MRRGRWLELADQEVSRFHRHQRPFAVLIADLDHFKRINDTHGHLAGDDVLRQFAELLRQESRQFDLVGRLGGEEFGILLPETGLSSARDVAWRIVRSCRTLAVPVPGAQIRLTCSVGVTVVEDGDSFISELLARADAAMYAAKLAGRDRVEVASKREESSPTT
jgi:diguanylate cyclase (GGDEF)-like protein